MRTLTLLISFVLFSQNINAQCQQPAKYLEQGSPAPCSGYLFSPEKEAELRLMSQNQELKDKKTQLLQEQLLLSESITIKERERAEMWRIAAEESSKKALTNDYFMILLGVGLTVLAGWSIGQVGR